MAETIKIGGEFESTATGNVVAAASAIKDKVKNKYQSVINAETDTTLAAHSSAINGLEGQNYVTLVATDADADIAAVFTRLNVTPAVNTVYRIANWKHDDNTTRYNVNYYSEYAANGNTTADLVPISVENKGIDEEPTAGSKNLVTSDGVKEGLNKTLQDAAIIARPWLGKDAVLENNFINPKDLLLFIEDIKFYFEKEEGYTYALGQINYNIPDSPTNSYSIYLVKYQNIEETPQLLGYRKVYQLPDNGVFKIYNNGLIADVKINWNVFKNQSIMGSGYWLKMVRLNQDYVFDLNTGIMYNEGLLSKIEETKTNIGYYKCSSSSEEIEKEVAVPGYVIINGGCFKIKFENANTADNVLLNINSQGAKKLYYKGIAVSSSNSWENNEVVSVYYDDTANSGNGGYFANPVTITIPESVEIVNNLTDGGVNKALSAEQGKKIGEELYDHEEIIGIIQELEANKYHKEQFKDETSYMEKVVRDSTSGTYTCLIPVSEGDKFRITGVSGNNNGKFAWVVCSDYITTPFIGCPIIRHADYLSNYRTTPAEITIQSGESILICNLDSYDASTDKVEKLETNAAEGLVTVVEDMVTRVESLEDNIKAIPKAHLAKKVYCVTNDENFVFTRGIIRAVNPYIYNKRIIGDVGSNNSATLYPRYLKLLFAAPTTTPKTLSMSLTSDKYDISDSEESQVIAKSPTEPANNINVLCLGSSTTYNGVWAGELKRRLCGNGGTPAGNNLDNITFVGRITGETNTDVQVEALSGWSWKMYVEGESLHKFTVPTSEDLGILPRAVYTCNDVDNGTARFRVFDYDKTAGIIIAEVYRGSGKSPLSSGTLTKESGTGASQITYTNWNTTIWSPFFNSNGVFDIQFYATKYCNGTIDAVVSNITYLNQMNGDPAYQMNMNEVITYIKIFVDAMHSAFPNSKIILVPGIGVSPNGGAEINYGIKNGNLTDYCLLYGEFRMLDKLEEFVETLNEDTIPIKYGNYCFIANTLQEVDMENAFPVSNIPVNLRTSNTEVVQNNAVHPNTNGYLMTADSMYRCFVCNVLN